MKKSNIGRAVKAIRYLWDMIFEIEEDGENEN